MEDIRSLKSDVKDYNSFIVHECDTPVLNIRETPYNNAIIIRDFDRDISRYRIFMELANKLKLYDQMSNVFGILFVNENRNSSDNLSVVLLLRNKKKFKRILNSSSEHDDHIIATISVFGNWVDIRDIKYAGYSLVYLKNDINVHQSITKNNLMMFDNWEEKDLFSSMKLFEHVVDKEELISIVATKTKVFVTVVTDVGEEDLLKALILNYGTDFDLRNCDDKLLLVKKNLNSMTQTNASRFSNDIKIVVNY